MIVAVKTLYCHHLMLIPLLEIQALGLALEPQSDDGLLSWNFFDRYLVPQWGNGYNQCPVYKVIDPVSINTEPAF